MVAGLPNSEDGGFGGGLQLYGSCTSGCLVDNNQFISNSVPAGDGGGFYASAPKSLVITNNLVEDNTSGKAVSCFRFLLMQNSILHSDAASYPGLPRVECDR